MEQDLVEALDAHDALVVRLATGQMEWPEFVDRYNDFYPRYPLDGHEDDEDDEDARRLLEKYASRIEIHRQVWEILCTIYEPPESHPNIPPGPGRYGLATGLGKLKEAAAAAGLLPPTS